MAVLRVTLPDQLVERFKLAVPLGKRSAFLRELIDRDLTRPSDQQIEDAACAASADPEHDQTD